MEDLCARVECAALLHDIGKVVLRANPSRQTHSEVGAAFLARFCDEGDADILRAVRHHHGRDLAQLRADESDISYIIYEADNLASASDRRVTEEGTGGFSATAELIYAEHTSFFSPLTKVDGSTLGFVEFISLMAWGIGYFGQPHILVRFMAIRHAEELPQATRIAMAWVVISLSAAILVGMVGAVYLKTPLEGTAAETVFLAMAGDLFPPVISGVVLAAVLAAIMSTASAQLLVAASAFAQDIYRRSFRPHAQQVELVWVSRLSVLAIAAAAIYLGMSPDNFILDMVAYAWAGFGASFGPALLMCLFWRRTTERGVLAGIVTGGITVLVWKQLALFGLYEIVPGFLFGLFAIYVVSKLDAEPASAVTDLFDRVNGK